MPVLAQMNTSKLNFVIRVLLSHEVLDKVQLTMEVPKGKCVLENLFLS